MVDLISSYLLKFNELKYNRKFNCQLVLIVVRETGYFAIDGWLYLIANWQSWF